MVLFFTFSNIIIFILNRYMVYHYFIEDLDVTNDNIADGVLIRQFKINYKKQQIIYSLNSYLSVNKLKSILELLIHTKKKENKSFILSNKQINDIKNFKIDIKQITRIIINKKSVIAQLLQNRPINTRNLINE